MTAVADPTMVDKALTVRSLQRTLVSGINTLDSVPGGIKTIIKRGMWQERIDDVTGELVKFPTFSQFIRKSVPYGLGTTPETLRDLCRRDPEALTLLDEALAGKPGNPTGANQHGGGNADIISVSSEPKDYGTSAGYTLRRLKSDAPELHARVLAGELSPHAAAVEAGFRKKTLTVPVDSPCAAIKALLRHFTADDLGQALASVLIAESETTP